MPENMMHFFRICVFCILSRFLIASSILSDQNNGSISRDFATDKTSKSTDIVRQLLNQETIIRMTLTNKVESIMKDMLTLKGSMETANGKFQNRISLLEAEVGNLKTENQQLGSELQRTKAGLQRTKAKERSMSSIVATVQASLSNVSSIVSVDISKRINELTAEVNQSKYDQLQLSSTVSSLEVFRMNLTNNIYGKTKKVGFSASVASSSSSWNSGTLVFPSVITNEGNGYNPSNGKFTAPTDGMYVFFVNVQSYLTKSIFVDVVLNGSTKVRTMAYSSNNDDHYDAGPNLVVLTIQKGDSVWIKFLSGRGYYTESNGPVTTFSGFLI